MAYFVRIAEDVELYIYGVDSLPEVRRQEILDACARDLGDNADHFLAVYPVAHESYRFEYEYAFIAGRAVYSFRFVVDGSQMASGIVEVIYVDYETTTHSP